MTMAIRTSVIAPRGRSRIADLGAGLLALAYVAFCVSDTLLTLDDARSQTVKMGAFVLVFAAILLRPRFHRMAVVALPVAVSLCIGMLLSFNADAGIEELVRFLFPVAITVAIFPYRDRLDVLVRAFIGVVVSNDLFQLYFYVSYAAGLPLFMPVRIDSGLFLRAQGWMGFFSEFSFINFCAFLLCRWYWSSRRAAIASWGFLLFGLLGFSFKLFAVLAVYPFVRNVRDVRAWLAAAGIAGLMLALAVTGALDSLLKVGMAKILFYVVAGNSARAESYRVMLESIRNGNLLGEGLGSFGGPASVKFSSPLYSFYHFDWYGLGGLLKTTDTFYPHLFVEMGVFGAIAWLVFVLGYGQARNKPTVWFYLVGAFCFDNIFSMAFVSPSYVFSALLVMYAFSWGRPGVSQVYVGRAVEVRS
ncbi:MULTISPECIES: hypothetical protein [unclassified Burkholderia]|uniref:hypothetical protein n=1 Tax=unclassified Burkholderia TaxID=2613784 RepID=UPI00141E5436|nr:MULTISPECIES: hypothetical protein [unclassified Burkholderia]NIE56302.1 hypothetical protein [Burkholderia sp. Ap-955]NIF08307.1 hypothetical protein [Burkholderia sp. Ax-1735]NIG00961.1 hypothetical protein [Burkholderia sp. Tr-849]